MGANYYTKALHSIVVIGNLIKIRVKMSILPLLKFDFNGKYGLILIWQK